MNRINRKKQNLDFVVCVKNENYSMSLEIRKLYQVVPDQEADKHNMLRIIDESGEDYLYPGDYFISIEVPQTIAKVFSMAV